MKKILSMAVALASLLAVLSGCTEDEFSTDQYVRDGVALNVYGPQPVTRGGQLRFRQGADEIANWQKMLKKTNADPKLCLLRLPDDFDELEENERYKVMNLSRRPEDRMPELLGPDLHKVAQSEGLFVSGAEVFVLFSVWSFTGKGSTGCSGTMLGLQFIKAGPSLGGAAKKASADDFEKLEQDEADEDPFAVEKVPF